MVYNEKVTLLKEDPETNSNPHKIYVPVYVRFNEDGVMKPFCMEWTDGKKFYIDRIRRVDRAASLKAGGCGIRYTCMIAGQEVQLFYEEDGHWFVTPKEH